jgi:phage gpG-like protein
LIKFDVDDTAIVARLGRMSEAVHAAVVGVVSKDTSQLADIVRDKLSGGVLQAVTGKLRASISSKVDDGGTSVTGSVTQSASGAAYGAIHEYGGITPPHDIIATKAKVLAFVFEGKQVFRRVVHHPGSQMPERSYMRSSLEDIREIFIADLDAAVHAAVGR